MSTNSQLYHRGFTLVELMLVVVLIVLLTGLTFASTATNTNTNDDIQRRADIKAVADALELYRRRQITVIGGVPSYPSAREFYDNLDKSEAEMRALGFYPIDRGALSAPGESDPSFIWPMGDQASESDQRPDIDDYIYQPRYRNGWFCGRYDQDGSGPVPPRACTSFTLYYRTSLDRTDFETDDPSDPSFKKYRSKSHQ
ncbi:hypothetical protein CR983_00680 [Candidatus Saccharibacteria bacterium]|nr:MAG: hypothetical protein CR983_00680 [Candidatus Saccharibacteria bacterium]